MGGLTARSNRFGREALALALAYALILQGLLFAIGAGLAAAPETRLAHILCAPGATAPEPAPAAPHPAPDCCIAGCSSSAADAPAAQAVATARPKTFSTAARGAPAFAAPASRPVVYPLGARAPPVPS